MKKKCKRSTTLTCKVAMLVIATFSALLAVTLPSGAQQYDQSNTGILSVDAYGFDDRIELTGFDQLRFVTSFDYPPYVFTRKDGRLDGFDVELARFICTILQRACVIQQRPFEQIGTSVLANEADIVMYGLRISSEVESVLDFTEPYLRQPGRFAVRTSFAGTPFTKESIKGVRLGVTAGTQHERFVKTYFPDAVIIPFPDSGDARSALEGRQIDAIFDDAMTLSFWLNGVSSQSCCRFLGGSYLLPEFFGDGIGMAVKDGNTELLQALNATLARMGRDGALAALYLKFFPISYF